MRACKGWFKTSSSMLTRTTHGGSKDIKHTTSMVGSIKWPGSIRPTEAVSQQQSARCRRQQSPGPWAVPAGVREVPQGRAGGSPRNAGGSSRLEAVARGDAGMVLGDFFHRHGFGRLLPLARPRARPRVTAAAGTSGDCCHVHGLGRLLPLTKPLATSAADTTSGSCSYLHGLGRQLELAQLPLAHGLGQLLPLAWPQATDCCRWYDIGRLLPLAWPRAMPPSRPRGLPPLHGSRKLLLLARSQDTAAAGTASGDCCRW
jgi:hypothetical protein